METAQQFTHQTFIPEAQEGPGSMPSALAKRKRKKKAQDRSSTGYVSAEMPPVSRPSFHTGKIKAARTSVKLLPCVQQSTQ